MRGATEKAAHSLGAHAAVLGDWDGMTLMLVDLCNAFNSISRPHIEQQVRCLVPELLPWYLATYGVTPPLFTQVRHIVESQRGVQQGDPLGPLYFCCGLMPLVNDIKALNPIYNKWYMMMAGSLVTWSCCRKCGICF